MKPYLIWTAQNMGPTYQLYGPRPAKSPYRMCVLPSQSWPRKNHQQLLSKSNQPSKFPQTTDKQSRASRIFLPRAAWAACPYPLPITSLKSPHLPLTSSPILSLCSIVSQYSINQIKKKKQILMEAYKKCLFVVMVVTVIASSCFEKVVAVDPPAPSPNSGAAISAPGTTIIAFIAVVCACLLY